MYGLTECKRVCYLPPEQLDARPTSVGVADPRHRGLDRGRARPRGRARARSASSSSAAPHVMQGYWNDAGADGAQAAARAAGRGSACCAPATCSGATTRATCTSSGARDDIIKSRGEKVAPREVEEVLYDAPGVREAAVVGVPDPLLGQAVHAHVVRAATATCWTRPRCAACARSASRTSRCPAA